MARPAAPRARPIVFWTIWRPHLTMAVSFAIRLTGLGLYLGALLAAGWAIALALGPQAYAGFKAVLGSAPGKAIMAAFSFACFFHLGGGVRHLVFDAGYGFSPKAANRSAAAVFAFAVAATGLAWAAAVLIGAA